MGIGPGNHPHPNCKWIPKRRRKTHPNGKVRGCRKASRRWQKTKQETNKRRHRDEEDIGQKATGNKDAEKTGDKRGGSEGKTPMNPTTRSEAIPRRSACAWVGAIKGDRTRRRKKAKNWGQGFEPDAKVRPGAARTKNVRHADAPAAHHRQKSQGGHCGRPNRRSRPRTKPDVTPDHGQKES